MYTRLRLPVATEGTCSLRDRREGAARRARIRLAHLWPLQGTLLRPRRGPMPQAPQSVVVPTGPLGAGGTTFRRTTIYGAHQAAGWILKVPFGILGPSREPGWRRCSKCKMLFWNGEFVNRRGVCIGTYEGTHSVDEGSRDYSCRSTPSLGLSSRTTGASARNASFVFFWPHNVDDNCAAGGRHSPHAYNYVLDVAQ